MSPGRWTRQIARMREDAAELFSCLDQDRIGPDDLQRVRTLASTLGERAGDLCAEEYGCAHDETEVVRGPMSDGGKYEVEVCEQCDSVVRTNRIRGEGAA